MGRGRSKGKTQKGKASGSSRHPEAARLHAQEVNAKRRADGKETKSTASISRPEKGAAAPRGKGQAGACADRGQVALAGARHDGQGKG